MKLLLPIFLLLFSTAKAITVPDIVYVGDTTLNGTTWNLSGKTLRIDGVISNGTITNALVEGNMFRQLFDTTLTVGTGCRVKEFSMMWYGAKTATADNSRFMQKAIDACLDRFNLYIPTGVFKFATGLTVAKLVGDTYQQCRLNMYGDPNFWASDCQLWYTGTDGFALGVQRNKGSEFHHFYIRGGFVPPAGTDSSFFRLTNEQYTNQGLGGAAKGFVVDFYGDYSQRSGSTGISVHDVFFDKFDMCVKISNGFIQNGEIILFVNIHLGDCRVGFEGSQSQEKYNVINNVFSWGSVHTIFSNGVGTQAGNYFVKGMNIAGRCRRIFNIATGGTFTTHISDIYGESVGEFGPITSNGLPVTITNCSVDFITADKTKGALNIFTTNGLLIQFFGCTFRYYGGTQVPLKATGTALSSGSVFLPSIDQSGWQFGNNFPTIIQGAQVKIKTAVKVSP